MGAEAEQEWEQAWWGTCANTFGEEQKQLTYALLMGLFPKNLAGKFPVYDLVGRSVLDVGGGPVSMLLKTVNGEALTVVDPLPMPPWVKARYKAAGIDVVREPAETYRGPSFDEAWIYNVLQHVRSPSKVIASARRAAPVVRIFDWIETPRTPGHPHTLHAADLDRWLRGRGTVTQLAENGCYGLAYHGVFPNPL